MASVELEAPEHKHVSNVDGIAYVRPHDLSISRTKQSVDAIPAKVSYSHAVTCRICRIKTRRNR